MSENEDDLDPREAAALAALRREAKAPRILEDATVRRLGSQGLLRKRRTALPLRLAAAVVLLASGFAMGRAWPGAPAPESGGPRWLLLLEGDPPLSVGEEATRVAEYGAWARSLAKRGELVVAEKLAREEVRLEGGNGGAIGITQGTGGSPSGFFLVKAADEPSALAVARSCPHLRHGGRVVLRRVVSTGG